MGFMSTFNGAPPIKWTEVRLPDDYRIQSDAGVCAIALAGVVGLRVINESLLSSLDAIGDASTRPEARPYPIGGS